MPESRWWLATDALDAILDELAKSETLVAPVRRAGEVLFRPVGCAADICRDYVNSLVPPKRFFLPSPEALLRYHFADGQPVLDGNGVGGEPPALVLFGVRSCDVAGLEQLTRFFSGESLGHPESADGPFMRRRRHATILSVVCQKPGETCMCVCCKGGPDLESGYDWQLTELAKGWLVEVGSERGQELAARFAARMEPAPDRAVQEKARRVHEVVEQFYRHSARRVQTMAAGRMTSQGRLSGSFWADLGERCVECGGCAFVCPTCSCFNVADLTEPGADIAADAAELESAAPGGPVAAPTEGAWQRMRLRDNCMLAGFVRQAGGAYPRASCGERCQTRFFHKLSWQFVQRTGALGCTGCGRCAIVCLSGIGIDRVSALMTEELVGAKGA
jgi:formate hydrogenlyase subunit 6/NADH:ubiquinone oxidoreductase subunit I